MNDSILTSFFDELEKISMSEGGNLPRGRKGFWQGAKAEVGPAAGAVLGAGLAQAAGISPVVGAAGGYGVGAIPEIIRGIMARRRG